MFLLPTKCRSPRRSPSYFREEHAWPRAGAVTPPRPRPPLNFSWVAEPPSLGAGVREGSCAATGRSLFSDSAASLAPPSEGGGRAPEEHGTATGGFGGAGRAGDEWKAQWSRRLLRGPMHSEYQDRFPWPPRSALKATSAVYASSAPAHPRGRSAASASNTAEARVEGSTMSPVPYTSVQARSVSPLRQQRRGRGRGRADGGGSSRGAREEGGLDNLGARGVSEPPRRRRTAADSLTELPWNEPRLSSSVDAAVVQHGSGAEDVTGNEAATRDRAETLVEDTAIAAPAGAVPALGGERLVGNGEARRVDDAAVKPFPLSEELGSGTRFNVSSGREWAGGRDRADYATDLHSKVAEAGDSTVAEANAAGRAWDAAGGEAWKQQAVGRGETTMTSGDQTLDYSRQVCTFCAIESAV